MIGIFDSGVGGLSYVKEFVKQFPEHDFMYLGDQLHVPYGGRSQEAIQNLTERSVQKLWEMGAELIIIACNTACSEALRYLQHKYPEKKILGVLIPGVEKALEVSKSNHIGVVATKGTVKSKVYETEILKRNSSKKVFQVTAPLMVPFIEEALGKTPEARRILKKYLSPLKNAGVQTLVLACTHYPHIQSVFQSIMGNKVVIVNPESEAVNRLSIYLENHSDISGKLSRNSQQQFFTTDCPINFAQQAQLFYGKKIEAEKIEI